MLRALSCIPIVLLTRRGLWLLWLGFLFGDVKDLLVAKDGTDLC